MNRLIRKFLLSCFPKRFLGSHPKRMSEEELGQVLGSWTDTSIHYRAAMQLIEEDEEEALQGALDELAVATATMNTHRIVGYLSTVGAMRELRKKIDAGRAANRDDISPDARK